jgi:hypothetical protein
MPLEKESPEVNGYLAEIKTKGAAKGKEVADLWLAENPESDFTFDPSTGKFQTVIPGATLEERKRGVDNFLKFVEKVKENGLVIFRGQARCALNISNSP